MGRPCNGCERGSPFVGPYRPEDQCRPCWLYYNNPQYKALYDGQPIPPETQAVNPISQIGVLATDQGVSIHPSIPQVDIYSPLRPGPGTQLHNLFAELGLNGWSGCPCAARARQMDAWGVEGCKAHRSEIIGWMKEAREHLGWMEFLKAATKLAFKVNPFDPLGSLLDEAIRRAAM